MGTTNGNRLHIGFFGKRNAGKSTTVNDIIGQNLSIVSDKKGTTTDVNKKAMELLPVGPVLLMDTAGIDDVGELGTLRVEKTVAALNMADVAVFVCDNEPLTLAEKDFLLKIKETKTPVICVINKTDINLPQSADIEYLKNNSDIVIERRKNFTDEFKSALIKILPDDFVNSGVILKDLINEKETCVLVVPIDKEAPKGRLILPQVNSIRELLDNRSICVVCTEMELEIALNSLKNPPKLVVCDSQAFKKVSETVPENIPLTSFSILFARLKGDLLSFVEGSCKLDNLSNNDKILVLESCSHHPVEDDIGRVKIPNLIKKYSNCTPVFEHYSGHDFPKNIKDYSLIIHCGACMTNRKEVLWRINLAKQENVPITNYGITIAKCTGNLERALKPLMKK